AFAYFNVLNVVNFTADDIQPLMQDARIVRNRLKIAASVNNAQRFIEIQKEFGSFSNYQWQFVGNKQIISDLNCVEDTPEITEESKSFAKALKKRGFKFLGPTTVYAH
ncbi:DNA-3-methyladenine glycosylase I, partial [Pseudoalteromonas sp. S1691]|uniref:DNA-3-methyladenine glycosylase I n=1 Tax=Pseudoalteromonas sp. S1691 TaxID=579513 RepID=UPI00110D0E57